MQVDQDFFVWKILVSLAGAVLSLAYFRPRNLIDAISRGVVSLLSGVIFAFIPMQYFVWDATTEHWLAASAAVALFSWVIIGALIKVISSMVKIPTIKK